MTHSKDSGDVWANKPFWCQPWTIVLTGMGIVGGSWLVFHRLWISVPVGGAIALWWWTFLVVMPLWYEKMLQLNPDSNAAATT